MTSQSSITATPNGLDVDEQQRIGIEASERVVALLADDHMRDYLETYGGGVLQTSQERLEALNVNVGALMREPQGSGSAVVEKLDLLRERFDALNPHNLSEPEWFRKWFGWLPFVDSETPPSGVLRKISGVHRSSSGQINSITGELRLAKDRMLRDTIRLNQSKEAILEQQYLVQKSAFLAECMYVELTKPHMATDNSTSRDLQDALVILATRIQDLRTMEQVNLQFLASIDLMQGNNRNLGQAVDSTLGVARNLVSIARTIQEAIQGQRQIAEALQGEKLAEITEIFAELFREVARAKVLRDEGVQTADQISTSLRETRSVEA